MATRDCTDHILESACNAGLAFAIIASPAPYHVQQTDLLVRRGVRVLVEKPLATSSEEAMPLLSLSEAHLISVGYCMRFLEPTRIIKSMLADNELFRPFSVQVAVGQDLRTWRPHIDYRESVSAQASLGGGVLLEMNHELDLLQWWFGALHVDHCRIRNTGFLDIDVEDIVDAQLHTSSGVCVQVHLDFLQLSPQRQITLIAHQGRLVWNLLNQTLILENEQGQTMLYQGQSTDYDMMYKDMMMAFVDTHMSRQSCASIEEAFRVLTVIDAMKGCENIGGGQ
ncbi:Gfo/Idh/MocA family oxidoreductase [Aestuariibacter halophilus]|uniref:Gfo/Idh/MocA family oxidoreductase n=1 Tax=Fluctibacter halophilus TaxID=226011 RepID=A0ABS8G617_9ALTE|nr:Gfo/Idh/MocA family oxidoreductase [Aestuariibacter halophilus]MCC2615129.1 Gfo/Idh/MocA family oxidoreductase [Aestuariibacter halophilus]